MMMIRAAHRLPLPLFLKVTRYTGETAKMLGMWRRRSHREKKTYEIFVDEKFVNEILCGPRAFYDLVPSNGGCGADDGVAVNYS